MILRIALAGALLALAGCSETPQGLGGALWCALSVSFPIVSVLGAPAVGSAFT